MEEKTPKRVPFFFFFFFFGGGGVSFVINLSLTDVDLTNITF